MSEIFSRNELLFGQDKQKALSDLTITVAGLGGVGGYTLDALARLGVKKFKIIDFDTVEESNINRQLIAFNSTIGKSKVELFKERLLDINNEIEVETFDEFYTKELNDKVLDGVDFVVDAIDTLRYKIDLIESAYNKNIKVISAFGAGNRIDPTQLRITDISKIEKPNCAFSKNILYQLKKRNITSGITAVVSDEKPIKISKSVDELKDGSMKIQVGSCVLVPSVMGYYIAYEILRQVLN